MGQGNADLFVESLDFIGFTLADYDGNQFSKKVSESRLALFDVSSHFNLVRRIPEPPAQSYDQVNYEQF